MTLIFYDQFTSAGEELTAHTPTDVGTGWTREVDASTGRPECLATDVLRWSTTPGVGGAAVSAQPDPATADVDVEITLANLTTNNAAWGVGIFARWADSSNYYGVQILPAAYATVDTRIFKKVSGVYTVLVSVSSDVGWAVSDVLKFELRGTTLKAYRNGTEILSVTDSALSAAGKAGVIWGNMTANGTSVANTWHLDDFKVREVTEQSASGGTTPSGAVVRSTAKSPAGGSSPAGTVNKSTAKSPSGSVTADGDIGKSAGKPLSGTLTPVGSLAQQASKSLSGDLPSDGDVAKNISKALAGSLSSSGALTVIRNFLAELTGTLLSAGDVNKGVSKSPSGTVDGEGDLARTTGKPTVGSISPTGLLTTIKLFVEDMAGSLAPTGEVLKQITKAFSGDIANTGETTKSTAKAFSGDLTSAGVLSSIRAFVRDIGGEAASAGAVTKSSAKSPSGSLSLSGGVAVQSQKSPAGQTQPSGVLSFLTGKGFPGNLAPSGALSTVFIPGGGTIYNQSAAGSAVLSGNLATLFTPGVPTAAGANIESWGGAFADDINPRPRRRTTPEPPVDDDEEAMVAILLSRFRK